MPLDKEREIVRILLDYMKEYNIPDEDKEKIYNIVLKIDYKTELQKERFIRNYGLKPKEFERESLSEIARASNVTPSAIRGSVYTIRHALSYVSDEDFLVLKKIYETII